MAERQRHSPVPQLHRPVENRSYSSGSSKVSDSDFSTFTKPWLVKELLLASKIIGYGALGGTMFFGLIFIGHHAYLEFTGPTPKEYSWITKTALHAARHHAQSGGAEGLANAAWYLEEAITRLDEELEAKGGWGTVSQEWREGYLASLMQLAEWEELLGGYEKAKTRWESILRIDSEWLPTGHRIKAALKVGELIDEIEGEEEAEKPSTELSASPPHNTAKGSKEDQAETFLILAYNLSLQEADPNRVHSTTLLDQQPGVIPPTLPPTSNLLLAATELGIHYARYSRTQLALPIFLSIYRAHLSQSQSTNTPPDPCQTGKIMSYIGEILFTSGKPSEGLSWSRRAISKTEGLAELRAACRECAVHASRNEVVMLRKLIQRKKKEGTPSATPSKWSFWAKDDAGMGEQEAGDIELQNELLNAENRLRSLLEIRISKGK